MNQILYTNTEKKSGALEAKTAVRIFAISIILFGVILAGKGIYSIISKKSNNSSENVPMVTLNQQANTVTIMVKHSIAIDRIVYSWNKGQENILLGKGRTEIEENIQVPEGSNLLTVKITDMDSKVITYTKQCESISSDVIQPEIELIVEGSKVKIVAKDETELEYISYHWNNEDETEIQATEASPKQIEEKIDVLKGENTLTVKAFDKSGNEKTIEQTYRGAKNPVIDVQQQGKELIIKVTDEQNIKKIEYTLNDVPYSTDTENTGTSLNMKEIQFMQALSAGKNKLVMKVYSTSGLMQEYSEEFNV